MVDLSIALLGQPTTVWARLGTLGSSFANGDTRTITLGFASGATALLAAVLVTPFAGRLALFGSTGWMEICDRTHPESPSGWDVKRVVRGAAAAGAYYPPHQAVRDNLEAFGRAAMGGAPYPVSHEEMLANVKTFEAIQRSVANGQVEAI
jgi:predicted dehydrogenase